MRLYAFYYVWTSRANVQGGRGVEPPNTTPQYDLGCIRNEHLLYPKC